MMFYYAGFKTVAAGALEAGVTVVWGIGDPILTDPAQGNPDTLFQADRCKRDRL